MKKKIMSAFLLIAIGGLLIAAGYVMGGKTRAFSIGQTLGFKHWGNNMKGWGDNMENLRDTIKNKVPVLSINETPLPHAVSQIKRLHVDISFAALEIIPHEEDTFTYSISNNTEKIGAAVEVRDVTLNITTKRYKKNKFFSSLFFTDWEDPDQHAVIIVKIPKQFTFETVNITSGASAVLLDGFNAQRAFTLTTGVGATEVNNIVASNVKIITGVGETEFKNCTFTDTVMENGVGALMFDGLLLKDFKFVSGIGSADLNINGKKDDYLLNITSGIGSVFVDDARIGSIGSSFHLKNDSSVHKLTVENGIGEVNINFKN